LLQAIPGFRSPDSVFLLASFLRDRPGRNPAFGYLVSLAGLIFRGVFKVKEFVRCSNVIPVKVGNAEDIHTGSPEAIEFGRESRLQVVSAVAGYIGLELGTAFRKLGGFEDVGVPSDTLFWLRACAAENTLLLPADLFWYRTPKDQEFHSPAAQAQYAKAAGWMWDALNAASCPLTPDEREQAKRNRAFRLAKRTLQDVRRGQWRYSFDRVRHSKMTVADWLRYLRPPRHDAFAGTPLDANGEFVVPTWSSKR